MASYSAAVHRRTARPPATKTTASGRKSRYCTAGPLVEKERAKPAAPPLRYYVNSIKNTRFGRTARRCQVATTIVILGLRRQRAPAGALVIGIGDDCGGSMGVSDLYCLLSQMARSALSFNNQPRSRHQKLARQ